MNFIMILVLLIEKRCRSVTLSKFPDQICFNLSVTNSVVLNPDRLIANVYLQQGEMR